MKSSGDDNDASGSQDKPPLGSPRYELNGKAIKINPEALFYLNEVKDTFHDQEHKYRMFLDVMKDFRAKRIDNSTMIARLTELFKGHNNLIIGFNTFLPPANKITLGDEEDTASSSPPLENY